MRIKKNLKSLKPSRLVSIPFRLMLFIHRLHRLTQIHFKSVVVFPKICENLRNLWIIKKFSTNIISLTGLTAK